VDAFTLIADPTRRKIIDRLRVEESDVGGLIELLQLPQPLVSKHLRVLRDAGAVTATAVGKRRVYRLAAEPLPDLLAWVAPYHERWATSLDQLAETLDEEEGS
jgi:DNA-binding transcriptional ArsR family regulator